MSAHIHSACPSTGAQALHSDTRYVLTGVSATFLLKATLRTAGFEAHAHPTCPSTGAQALHSEPHYVLERYALMQQRQLVAVSAVRRQIAHGNGAGCLLYCCLRCQSCCSVLTAVEQA